ncbi:MAG: UDP-N-acetylmuramate dehydrogenase [Rikenellaceae bacterium]
MIRFFNNISLSERNSFHVDVKAKRVVEFSTADDLVDIFIKEAPEEWLVLSGGNNILFTKDYNGLIVCPVANKIKVESRGGKWSRVRVDAGVEWDDLVEWAVEKNLWGIENLSLIPGKAGAAPVQNIGAYGVEVKDLIEEVEIFDTETLSCYTLMGEDCEFAYRDSIFKRELKGRVIVTSMLIKLYSRPNPQLEYADVRARVEAKADGVTLRNIRDVICEIRTSKLPDTKVLGNAGSFFKNPVVPKEICERLLEEYPSMPHYDVVGDETKVKLAAGWLIDQAGMKGYRQGNVGVHDAQALVLVNWGGGSGVEILDLAQKVQSKVAEKFGVEISAEVNILPEFNL